jgi:hypothetical protein
MKLLPFVLYGKSKFSGLGYKNVESSKSETTFKAKFMFINPIVAEYFLGYQLNVY